MKKTISVFLSLFMLVNLVSVSAFAANEDNIQETAIAMQLSDEFHAKHGGDRLSLNDILDDMSILEESGWNPSEMYIDSILENGNIVYAIELSSIGITSYIDVYKGADGSRYLHFREGDLENTLCIKPDGSMWGDGHKISVTADTFHLENNIGHYSGIVPFAGNTRTYSKVPPDGTKASEYSTSGMLISSNRLIDFGITLGAAGIAYIATCLTAGFSNVLAATIGFCSGEFYSVVANKLKSMNPNSQYASFKEIRYPRNKDQVVYHFQYKVYVYAKSNYEGSSYVASVCYETVTPT